MNSNAKDKKNRQLNNILFKPADAVTQSIMGSYLDVKTQHAIIQTCKHAYKLFQPNLMATGVKQILLHVAHGEEKKLKKMKINPQAFLARGTVYDYSSREFPCISAIELAAWSLDTEILWTLLEKLPENFKKETLQQLQRLEEQGVTYFFHGSGTTPILKTHEAHYNFSILPNSLQFYSEHIFQPNFQVRNYWLQIIRPQQRLTPVHFIEQILDCFDLFPVMLGKIRKKITLSWFSSEEIVPGLGVQCKLPITYKEKLISSFLSSLSIAMITSILVGFPALLFENKVTIIQIIAMLIMSSLVSSFIGTPMFLAVEAARVNQVSEIHLMSKKRQLEVYSDEKIYAFKKIKEQLEEEVRQTSVPR